MNYNPYFPGGAISMPRVIFDGLVEYDDGMCFLIVFFLTLLAPNVAIQALPRRPHNWPRTSLLS